MAAAGAAATEGKKIPIGPIEAQMDQAAFIGGFQDRNGLAVSDLFGQTLFDELLPESVQQQANVQWVVAALVMAPANTVSQSDQLRTFENVYYLRSREHPLFFPEGFPYWNHFR